MFHVVSISVAALSLIILSSNLLMVGADGTVPTMDSGISQPGQRTDHILHWSKNDHLTSFTRLFKESKIKDGEPERTLTEKKQEYDVELFPFPSKLSQHSFSKKRQLNPIKRFQNYGNILPNDSKLRKIEKMEHLDPDANRNLTELISTQGYPVQTYVVQTRDGFLLDLHRIPWGRLKNQMPSKPETSKHHQNQIISEPRFASERLHHNSDTIHHKEYSNPNTKPIVFLQHGYTSSACDFVMNFANDSLAFILADSGYDVWLGNSRGNTYSNRHVNLTKDDPRFWDWSFDEMAVYDTSAFIDFILNKTSQSSLHYIGHSQGTIVAFALLSEKPEYQEKIRLFVGLAPIMSLSNMVSPMRYLAEMSESDIYKLLGRKDCFETTDKSRRMADTVCAKPVSRWVCYAILSLSNGPDITNINKARLPVYMNHTPAGTSVKNVVHYAQMVREKRFAKYDYGSSEANIQRYGQPIPPAYNVRSIRIPAVLFSGFKDWLADPKDVSILESTLPNIIEKYHYPTWNHMDFVLGITAAKDCYNRILNVLPKF